MDSWSFVRGKVIGLVVFGNGGQFLLGPWRRGGEDSVRGQERLAAKEPVG